MRPLKQHLILSRLNARLKPERMLMAVFYPYPKTALYDYSISKGYIPRDLPYSDEVNLTQPQFPKEQVEFISIYARQLVRLYRFIDRLPDLLKNMLNKLLDAFVITRFKPHGLLNITAKTLRKAINRFKSFIRTRFPSLYLRIRDLLIIKQKG